MRFASGTDHAIRLALVTDTLKLVERPSRLGGTFIAVEDSHGVIEVHDDLAAANARIDPIKETFFRRTTNAKI